MLKLFVFNESTQAIYLLQFHTISFTDYS